MTVIIDGTAGITFPNSTTQAVAGAPLTTPSFTTTIGVGAATASASGAGVTFPATQSASSDANTLDDYEEGTWTPVANNITVTGGSCNYLGYYLKIGRLVFCTMSINIGTGATFTSTRNSSYFSGLPFTINSTYQSTCTMSSNAITNDGVGMCYSGPVFYIPTVTFTSGSSLGWVSGTYITTA